MSLDSLMSVFWVYSRSTIFLFIYFFPRDVTEKRQTVRSFFNFNLPSQFFTLSHYSLKFCNPLSHFKIKIHQPAHTNIGRQRKIGCAGARLKFRSWFIQQFTENIPQRLNPHSHTDLYTSNYHYLFSKSPEEHKNCARENFLSYPATTYCGGSN